jgi:hypothetical protein
VGVANSSIRLPEYGKGDTASGIQVINCSNEANTCVPIFSSSGIPNNTQPCPPSNRNDISDNNASVLRQESVNTRYAELARTFSGEFEYSRQQRPSSTHYGHSLPGRSESFRPISQQPETGISLREHSRQIFSRRNSARTPSPTVERAVRKSLSPAREAIYSSATKDDCRHPRFIEPESSLSDRLFSHPPSSEVQRAEPRHSVAPLGSDSSCFYRFTTSCSQALGDGNTLAFTGNTATVPAVSTATTTTPITATTSSFFTATATHPTTTTSNAPTSSTLAPNHIHAASVANSDSVPRHSVSSISKYVHFLPADDIPRLSPDIPSNSRIDRDIEKPAIDATRPIEQISTHHNRWEEYAERERSWREYRKRLNGQRRPVNRTTQLHLRATAAPFVRRSQRDPLPLPPQSATSLISETKFWHTVRAIHLQSRQIQETRQQQHELIKIAVSLRRLQVTLEQLAQALTQDQDQ